MKFLRIKKIFFLSAFLLCACNNDVSFQVPTSSESFNQNLAYNNKVDFLFVVDNSDSMGKVQSKLLASLVPLTATLRQLKLDYRIASTSTTMADWFPMAGRFFGEPRFITLDTPDFDARLTEKIVLGNDGATQERGLQAIKNVLSPLYQGGEGQGFLRQDSLLVIVYISNENDKSDNIDTTPTSKDRTKFYSDFLDQLKPTWSNGQRSWIFNFIGFISAGDPCTGGDLTGFKEVGALQMEMAQKSNGKIESICQANLSGAISSIKARLVEYLTDYRLSQVPALDSIRVYVNQQLVPKDPATGWSYIPEIRVIRFNGASVPKADDDIRVEFLPADVN